MMNFDYRDFVEQMSEDEYLDLVLLYFLKWNGLWEGTPDLD